MSGDITSGDAAFMYGDEDEGLSGIFCEEFSAELTAGLSATVPPVDVLSVVLFTNGLAGLALRKLFTAWDNNKWALIAICHSSAILIKLMNN